MLDTFTEVYDKSAEVLRGGSLHASWHAIEMALRTLVGSEVPQVARAQVLEQLREKLRRAAIGSHVR